ncbi:MAG: T9SS type A sorting domain-containing protein, partial [Bacteroidota bacterium]
TNSLIIPLLASGSSTTITFAAFNPTVGGINNISVSTLPDQNNANNLSTYTQSVTCDTWSQKDPTIPFNQGVGFNTGSGIIASKYDNPITTTLTAINLAVGNATQNVGNSIYGVLMDALGNIMALTNTITITPAMYGLYQTFTLTPYTLSPGTYYLGIAQPANVILGYFPLAAASSSFMPTTIYVTSLLTGGFIFASTTNLGYFGIDGVFAKTTTISATSPSTIVCDGTPITLTANGATTYTWSTGPTTPTVSVTQSVNTTYSVTGTNIVGCMASASVSLATNPSPTVTAVGSSTGVCPGSSVSLTASGAITYTWSTGPTTTVTVVNPTVATTYSVAGTNTIGCSSTGTVAIAMNVPTIAITGPSAICNGTSANISASGASSYTWSTGSSAINIIVGPTVTTTYSVSGTNTAGCVGTTTLSLIVNPNPVVNATANPSMICSGESATLTASGASSYSWNTTSTLTSIAISPSVTTNYTVVGTNTLGCSNTKVIVQTVNACVGIKENNNSLGNLNIFPNPNNGVFSIDFTTLPQNSVIEIYSTLGVLVKKQAVISDKNTVNMQAEANGLYFIYVISGEKAIKVSKIVKQ